MSIAELIKLAKLAEDLAVDPEGRKYHSKKIEGADKGHWRVVYTYKVQGGFQETSFWERMPDEIMIKTQCFAEDYKGSRR